MQSHLTIDKEKAETVLFKMGLCLWICRDFNFFKVCYIIGRTYSKVTNICIGIGTFNNIKDLRILESLHFHKHKPILNSTASAFLCQLINNSALFYFSNILY